MPKFKSSKLWLVVGALVLLNIAVWLSVWESRPRDFASLHFLDVGQGDALYLRTPEGSDVVMDGGPGETVLAKLGRLMPFFDRSIEFLVLTHPHADHVAGLIEVLKRYQVKHVLLADSVYSSATYAEFLKTVSDRHIPIARPKLGERVYLDRETILDVYYPFAGQFAELPKDLNDASIVSRLAFGQIHVLLTGDAGYPVEAQLLKLGLPLGSEILKVAHHGSKSATGPEFLAAVHPTYAVISVGRDNSYGLPDQGVTDAIQQAGAAVLRTDQGRDIIFRLYPDRVVAEN